MALPRRFREWFALILCCVFVATASCMVGYMAKDARSQQEKWFVFGGNGDNLSLGYRNALFSVGRVPPGIEVIAVPWPADITRTAWSTGQGIVNIRPMWFNAGCTRGVLCKLMGHSLGSEPAIVASYDLGVPGLNVTLEGAPQPATGIWHADWINNIMVKPWLKLAGLPTDTRPKPGTWNLYHNDDIYANAAPNAWNPCAIIPMAIATAQGRSHRIFNIFTPARRWTGIDGVNNIEFGIGDNIMTRSGSDPVSYPCGPARPLPQMWGIPTP